MKRVLLLLFLFIPFLVVNSQSGKHLVILHTNDLHSRMTGFAPEPKYTPLVQDDDGTIGGFARIAGIIKSEKTNSGDAFLVVDAGDFTMGTLFPAVELETGFQLRLMKTMGYDAVGLGNHEFDFGSGWLAAVIRKSASAGEIPCLISSNSQFSAKDTADDAFAGLFDDSLIFRSIVLEKNGLRIGLFSIIGKDADRVAPRAAPVTFEKQSKAATRMVRALKDEKCDIIICLSHSGVEKGKNGEWEGEDVELAKKVRGIDLIIGGHSHTVIEQPIVVNGVPIVQTGEFGKNVGRLSLLFTEGRIITESYILIPVNDKVESDAYVSALIEKQKQVINEKILNPLGLSYTDPIAEADFILTGNAVKDFIESNLGPLVADAIHYYVNRESSRRTDLSIVAAGMIFDRIVPGIQTAPDIFRVMPLGSGEDNVPGYPLARLYVTGKEMKSILEILQVAYKSSPDNYCYYSGIRVGIDPNRGLFRKIKKIEIVETDSTLREVNFGRKDKTLYSITADSYMLEFIGIIRKLSFGLVNVVPKDHDGRKITDIKKAVIDMDEQKEGVQEGKEWLALIDYFKSMRDLNNDGLPDIETKYSIPVKCFFTVADTR
jgi:5'-nucleotidase/UDP-sugar diphosphatase